MALTTDQLKDLRADLGDSSSPPAFSDTELQRLFARTGEDYNATVVLAIDQLLINASKLHDYTAGQTSEKISQVFAQLTEVRKVWASRIEAMRNKPQVRITRFRQEPPVARETPAE